jgi:hypothetical protein
MLAIAERHEIAAIVELSQNTHPHAIARRMVLITTRCCAADDCGGSDVADRHTFTTPNARKLM